MRHDSEPYDGLLYRWNDPLHRVDVWIGDQWEASSQHLTTVTIPFHQLVNYEDTWAEPCQGITALGDCLL